jgi:enamine deaminase RidA (YjgF/YER057c/UK114 family)
MKFHRQQDLLSPAVRAERFVFLSGQVALCPVSNKLISGDVAAQTKQIFKNLRPCSVQREEI